MDRIGTLEIAIRNEKAEIDFYRGAAARATDRGARTLFEMLADQEEHHVTMHEQLAERLAEQSAWPAELDLASTPQNILEVLDGLHLLGVTDGTEDLGQDAALERAIGFERAAEQFYGGLAAAATDQGERQFWTSMAGFERDHRRWIETFRAAFAEAGDR